MTTRLVTPEQALKTLQEAGYRITPPGSQQAKRNIIREKLADPNECLHLLDRSQPKPEWAEGKEEQILKELEIQLLGIWDHMSPFG